jgi:hypothetical protein
VGGGRILERINSQRDMRLRVLDGEIEGGTKFKADNSVLEKKNEIEEEEEMLSQRSILRRAPIMVAPYYTPRGSASLTLYSPPWEPS